MRFAEMLQQARRERGLTQEQLAELLGVSRQSISKWEIGDTYPETERLILLAGKLNTSLDDLLKEEILAARGKYQESGNKRDDVDEITALFAEKFPPVSAKKHAPKGKCFRWSDENIRRAMEYLEGTSWRVACSDSSRGSYKRNQIIHDGKLFSQIAYADGRTDTVEVLGRDKTISWLDLYRFTRRLKDVNFEYYDKNELMNAIPK